MIKVLKKAFDILELIAQEPERPKGLGEIAQPLGFNQATCAHILKTLVDCNYVEQIAPRKGYVLGPMAYFLVRQGPYRKDLIGIAEPVMTGLAPKIQETVLIATIHNGKRFVLSKVDGTQELKISSDVIFADEAYSSATGRLLLAYLSPENFQGYVIKNSLPGKFWTAVNTRKKLDIEMERIRTEEMAISTDRPQVVGIACPIKSSEGVVAALGVYLPKYRFSGSHKKKVLSGLKIASQRISSILLDS